MTKIIAVCNQKGGVGKTTTSINLSTVLATSGKRVLLVDIDPQGNATSGLGLDKHAITASAYDILLDGAQASAVIQKTFVENLSIIPANDSLAGAEVELVGSMGREFRLRKALATISHDYDFIIIDCPPSLGLLTVNALSAALSVLIPVQCEYYALEGLAQLSSTITLVRENLNPQLAIEGVLMTMADYRTKHTNEVIAEVRKAFGNKVYETVIPRNVKLTEAPSFGKPITLYDKHSIGAQKYQAFAEEVLGVKKAATVEQPGIEPANTLANNVLQENTEKRADAVVSDPIS